MLDRMALLRCGSALAMAARPAMRARETDRILKQLCRLNVWCKGVREGREVDSLTL